MATKHESGAADRSAIRRERAERILDATARLLQAHGYRRVTIEDVSGQAGIGKGTIYLHWKTREALFWAALQRESVRLLEEVSGRLAEDAALALPHRLMPAIFTEVARRPLVKAVLLGDGAVLGVLAADETVAGAQRELAGQPDYLKLLEEHGLLRTGLTAAHAAHVLSAVMRGFFMDAEADAGLEDADRLTTAQRAELLGSVMARALEEDRPPAPEAVDAFGATVLRLLRALADAQRSQLERAY
jgi:AcrR family transcriptional regulator